MTIEISLSIYFNKIINSNERLVLSMGLSFIALVLFANLTKGQTSTLDDRFIFPVYTENSKDCDIVIEFNTMSLSGNALYVTMTTNYNETYTNVLQEIPFVMPLKPYLGLNASKVFTLTGNGTFTSTIHRLHGDVLQLFSTDCLGKEYVVCIEQDHFITIYGTDLSTTVTLQASDNTLNNTYILNYGETVSFKPGSSGVFHIVSTGKIGVIYSDKNLTHMCDYSDDIVWEMIPPTDQADRNFIIYIPEARSAYLEVIGYQDGQLTLHTAEESSSMSLKAFKRTIININQARYIQITSSTPVTVICIVNLTTGVDSEATNMFHVEPVQQSSTCLYFKAFNCTEAPCGYVTSKNATGHITLLDKDGNIIRVFNTSNQQANGSFSSWEINDVSDGIYSLQSKEMPFPFVVFYIDLSHGQYYQTLMSNKTICDRTSNTQSTNITAEENISITTLNYTDTTVPNKVSSYVSTYSTNYTTGAYTDDGNMTSNSTSLNASSGTQSSQSVPKRGSLLYLTSNTTTNNDTSVVQPINNRLLFPFMYEEIPEDDSVLNEYLIAVIVSLCTAIFAVIGVISTFLLLEVLRRRRQIRNTKIRPFVS